MNLIEAYKKADYGDIIFRPWEATRKKGQYANLKDFLDSITHSSDLLAEDWEVTGIPLVWTGEVIWRRIPEDEGTPLIYPAFENIPYNMCSLDDFINKRTRIHVEEIVKELK